jgi:hypothetical protein
LQFVISNANTKRKKQCTYGDSRKIDVNFLLPCSF